MTMKLSLSVRIAESASKRELDVDFADLAELARRTGYHAVCMRASAGGVQTPQPQLLAMRRLIEDQGLEVSMVTADFDVPLNNEHGPDSLRDIGPSLDVADALGCDLIRVCIKQRADIEHARRAADQAAERGIRLAHQCHTTTLFEQVEQSLEVLQAIGRSNFGLIYEPANLMLCGESYGLETLRRFQPYLMNVYLQNHKLDAAGPVELETWCLGQRRFQHIPLWEAGGVDFGQVFDALQTIAYDGYVTVHQAYGWLMGAEEAAQGSGRYLRSLAAFEDNPP